MIDKLINLINKEDKKNPYTDKELAEILNVDRELITKCRFEENIPNSRERRKKVLIMDVKKLTENNENISIRQLTKELNDLGYHISRHIVENTKMEICEEKEVSEKVSDFVGSSFPDIIGSEDSLKMQINQAKASVLYPPNGLHTLILGPSGTGKTQLAEAMFEFGIQSKRFKKSSPFIVFNCADYADNPQLLLSQLFGHVKGAFTGADIEKKGLVEKADGGILFLDEVHRLPNEGQEILFYLLDKGQFRRLGETESNRKVQIMLIAATTEDPESSLLVTFRRRVPMIIELPPLKERSLDERYKLITLFFFKEANRVKKKIRVESEVIKNLMTYDCIGNIGQLRSDIQVACARGFLKSKMDKLNYIFVQEQYLPYYTKNSIYQNIKLNHRIDKLYAYDLVFNPNSKQNLVFKQDDYTPLKDMYQYIEESFLELKDRGLNKEEINNAIGEKLEKKINSFAEKLKYKNFTSKDELKSIVRKEILEVSDHLFKIANHHFENLQNNFYYCLSVHLNATIERIEQNKKITNPQLEKVKKDYKKEFNIAKKMIKEINKRLNVSLPDDEAAFIAMYLRLFSGESEIVEGKVQVIILSHGHIAGAMADVANRLLGVSHAIGIEMDLNENPQSIVERAIDITKKVDEGKGCIYLADMGSLMDVGGIVTKKTNIPTRTIGRVDMVMVLEAVRRAILPSSTLDEIVSELTYNKNIDCQKFHEQGMKVQSKKAIVTICITGQGTALTLKQLLESKLDIQVLQNNEVEIIPLGLICENELNNQIEKIKRRRNIIAYVGTIDPIEDNVPFISMEEILEGSGIRKINKVISNEINGASINYADIIKKELILFDLEAYTKNEVIDSLAQLLYENGYVEKEFLLDVYKREALGSTVSKGRIAIPHGLPKNVTKPGIAIAKLTNPIEWEKNIDVDIVFMIAYKTDSKSFFKILYNILLNQQYLSEFKNSKSCEEIQALMVNKIKLIN